MTSLIQKHCKACEGGVTPMTRKEAETLLSDIQGWGINSSGTVISKKFQFKGFNKTMSFVNAVAWIANREGHHPDLSVTFNSCTVNFTTHAINGLSENDFICAAKVDNLLD